MEGNSERTDLTLLVALEGGLTAGDLFWEKAAALARAPSPWNLGLLARTLIRGKKEAAAVERRTSLAPEHLAYRQEVLDFLQVKKNAGRRLVLVSRENPKLAEQVAQHLGLFDEVSAQAVGGASPAALAGSLPGVLPGAGTYPPAEPGADPIAHGGAGALPGAGGVAYLGSWERDRSILESAQEGYAVVSSAEEAGLARACPRVVRVFAPTATAGKRTLQAIRVHQWLKNALVFVPLVTAHRLTEAGTLLTALLGFICLSLVASSVYLFNDFLDLEADRQHPRKRLRPMAAGEMPIAVGLQWAGVFLAAAVGLGFLFLPWRFLGVLVLYVAAAWMYSLWLKRLVLIDVLTLASLYTIRIVAGGVATAIPLSFWLLAFSMFLFTSLAFVKRYAELAQWNGHAGQTMPRRGYLREDLSAVQIMGITCGVLAVLVVALYVNSADVLALYRHPKALWLFCPVLLYWIFRMWVLAGRGELPQDPVVYAATDRHSWIAALVLVLILLLATE
ncbi:MAG: UbiA family prenyltransferase [Phycisphaeraceae bacterium]|nr:UbiA family prenyltransferase [Phycisphaeraceae bacterium]